MYSVALYVSAWIEITKGYAYFFNVCVALYVSAWIEMIWDLAKII